MKSQLELETECRSWSWSSCGPLACEASVITNYTMRPQRIVVWLKQPLMNKLSQRNLASWQIANLPAAERTYMRAHQVRNAAYRMPRNTCARYLTSTSAPDCRVIASRTAFWCCATRKHSSDRALAQVCLTHTGRANGLS